MINELIIYESYIKFTFLMSHSYIHCDYQTMFSYILILPLPYLSLTTDGWPRSQVASLKFKDSIT